MSDKEMRVVLFKSRNKDNKTLDGFHERAMAFVTYEPYDSELLKSAFNNFVSMGVKKEICRFYMSVNTRDSKKIRKALLHELIDNEEFNLTEAESKIASIAMKHENSITKYWLIDFDADNSKLLCDFMHDLEIVCGIKDKDIVNFKRTLNGYHIVVEHGFDVRELIKKWADVVDIKRDALLYICQNVNEL